jgi:hypothetical protein
MINFIVPIYKVLRCWMHHFQDKISILAFLTSVAHLLATLVSISTKKKAVCCHFTYSEDLYDACHSCTCTIKNWCQLPNVPLECQNGSLI